MNIKEQLHNQCTAYVQDQTDRLKDRSLELQLALQNETKSSAGDKHETGRAMVQLEQEKLSQQLNNVAELQHVLHKINTNRTQSKIALGSVVHTTLQNYYLSISIGKLEVENDIFYAIAPNTPIGKVLLGKEISSTFIVQGKEHRILSIV